MAQPQKRYDGYGRPLPTLADVREDSFYDRNGNQHGRKMITAYLEEQYRALLHRGIDAELTLTIGIKNGIIMEVFKVGVTQRVHCEREDL